ncbi:hypothetical protein GCM10027167_34990 [Nocardia heshunensis]
MAQQSGHKPHTGLVADPGHHIAHQGQLLREGDLRGGIQEIPIPNPGVAQEIGHAEPARDREFDEECRAGDGAQLSLTVRHIEMVANFQRAMGRNERGSC